LDKVPFFPLIHGTGVHLRSAKSIYAGKAKEMLCYYNSVKAAGYFQPLGYCYWWRVGVVLEKGNNVILMPCKYR